LPDPWGWPGRLLVIEAMARLAVARFLVSQVRFRRWRHRLGRLEVLSGDAQVPATPNPRDLRLAAAVDRGALHLPGPSKCLPRAMALQAMLHCRHRPTTLVLATLPHVARGTLDDLHAWIECEGFVLIGESAQPYRVMARFSLP
jgi:Transglutaminase-like superfamily